MSLTWAISLWLLVTYVLIASASLSDRTDSLCVRQPPTQLRYREHLEHYQGTFLPAAIHSVSSTPVLTTASNLSSYQTIDNETVFEPLNRLATRTNATQLAENLGGLDLARESGDSGETPTDEQHNDTSNDSDEERCPTGFDTLDCEECGGPEHTWEMARHDYHCKGIEAENYRWKDCFCFNDDDPFNSRRGCTFDSGSDDGSSQHDSNSDDESQRAPHSDNNTRNDADSDDDSRYDFACEADG